MSVLMELIIAALILIGAFFLLVGSIGLVKLSDTMRRLHGPTKATTLGIGSLLIASMLYFYTQQGQLSFHELMITLFLFLTAPVTANMLAKTHLLRSDDIARELPSAGPDTGWSTLHPDKSPSERG